MSTNANAEPGDGAPQGNAPQGNMPQGNMPQGHFPSLGPAHAHAHMMHHHHQHQMPPPLINPLHRRSVMTAVIDKTLINLSVLAKVEEGDKLGWTSDGKFIIQKPTWLTTGMRFLRGIDRWITLEHINDVINNAELIEEHGNVAQGRIARALAQSVHGLKNLQATYKDNATVSESIQVIIDRLGERYNLPHHDLM